MAPPPGPYSGTSTFVLVASAPAFSFGLVYGNIKLKIHRMKEKSHKKAKAKAHHGGDVHTKWRLISSAAVFVKILFALRATNFVAHSLARNALCSTGDYVGLEEFPSYIHSSTISGRDQIYDFYL
ncbi:hypothetical protein LWI28_009942 [Acer negundo]|uniref:Uncharacterized protein n=1 Tax=Acer negundo TaxID=4023 RepID=A0AAD5IZC2_ACENE|nr:hypothetical protein LWI28_009942 [Acer negundo]